MTVCIAAGCREGKDYALVLCADAKGTTPLGTKEMMLKARVLPHGWRCLNAGSEDDLLPLVRLFRNGLQELTSIDETNIVPKIQEALRRRKEQKADEYTHRKWGMSFADFRKAKAQFPEDEYRNDIAAVGQIGIEADCLLAGFLDNGLPLIVQAHGRDGVHIRDDFAVAGEGAWLAQYGMLHREHYDANPLVRTIYCAYEAKRYAERVPTVGPITYLVVVRKDGRSKMVSPEGLEYLRQQFLKYGPQGFTGGPFEMKPDFFFNPPEEDETR